MSISLEEVGEEFVGFFQHLLGSSKLTAPVEALMVQSGKCLEVASYSSFLAPVANEKIQSTLFSIENDKSS